MGIAFLLLPGCNLLRFVPKGESLVERNNVKVEGKEKIDNLKDQILLVPNRKMLVVLKFNLWSYYFGEKVFRKDSSKVKRFFTETIGEKPVYYDSVMVFRSEKNIKEYLYQKGYFKATVDSKAKTILKRSYITYYVNPGKPYTIRSVVFNGSDKTLDKFANEFKKNTLIDSGENVDFDKISEERDRLTTAYKNNGFFYFNKAFIEVKVDTGGHNLGANINYNISNPGSLRNARQQTMQKVTVEMNFDQRFGRKVIVKFKSIEYLFNGYNIKPNIIDRSIKLRPGDYFSQAQLEATYKKLIGLGLFRQVNIRIVPLESDTTNKLLVFISLTPSAKHDFIWEPQTIISDKQTALGSNNNRNYGLANSFILNNKNVFRNAEDFNIKFRVAAEKQFGGGSGVNVRIPLPGLKDINFRAGNFETNLTFELLFPKLVFLRVFDTSYKFQQNRTSFNVTMLTEINSNYYRRSLPINLTYQFLKEKPDKRTFQWYWSPVQLSFNKAEINQAYLRGLNPTDSVRLVKTFRNYIIPSHKLALMFSNREKKPTRYWNIRANIFEISGNLMELGYRILKKDNSKDKVMLGIPYFQYTRSDIDVVRYFIFAKTKSLILRTNSGLGLAYGNSTIMPFERQFFVGGSNNLRAWRPRVIGPGVYRDGSNIRVDKTADMMIVANAEYRFAIAPGALDGALFVDAGNIWQVSRKAPLEARFKFNSFYKQLALNTGIGARINLGFFIIRLDWGIPLHDPSQLKESRWVIKEFPQNRWIVKRTVINVAVGFPF